MIEPASGEENKDNLFLNLHPMTISEETEK
jgi:hypothetical protein